MDKPELVMRGRQATGLSQAAFGAKVGVSGKTVQRWEGNRSSPVTREMEKIAHAVLPRDPKLAQKIAAHVGIKLELPAPPPPLVVVPAPPSPPPVAVPTYRLDQLSRSVLCAAAEAASASPQSTRPVVIAVLEALRDLALTPAQVLEGLGASSPSGLPRKASAK